MFYFLRRDNLNSLKANIIIQSQKSKPAYKYKNYNTQHPHTISRQWRLIVCGCLKSVIGGNIFVVANRSFILPVESFFVLTSKKLFLAFL